MKHTAGTAAKAVGKTKSTITKAIASGKLSAVKRAVSAGTPILIGVAVRKSA